MTESEKKHRVVIVGAAVRRVVHYDQALADLDRAIELDPCSPAEGSAARSGCCQHCEGLPGSAWLSRRAYPACSASSAYLAWGQNRCPQA